MARRSARHRVSPLSAGAVADRSSDFHPVALACPLLLFAWWHLDDETPVGLRAAGRAGDRDEGARGPRGRRDGIWYAVRYRAPRMGATIAVLAGGAALVATLVVVPHFAPAGASAFESRYDSPSLDGRDLTTSPRCSSHSPSCRSPHPSRSSPPCPSSGSTCCPRRSRRPRSRRTTPPWPCRHSSPQRCSAPRGWAAARVLRGAMAVAAMVLLGPLGRVDLGADAHDAAARRALAVVPDGVPVSATNSLGAHLSDRRRIFSFPLLRKPTGWSSTSNG